ncbi:hypothetical protein [Avibacterium paragallinarum]|uniref:hypothetical protein n=1 Tax=Avibacterium paragallinarum TaxID=728 RepID=UPI00397B2F5C
MLKKLALLPVFLLSACSYNIANFSVVTSEPLVFDKYQYKKGKEVIGKSTRPVIYPIRIPGISLEVALNKAIQQDKCAIGLTNAKFTYFEYNFGFGVYGFSAEGNSLLKTQGNNCN